MFPPVAPREPAGPSPGDDDQFEVEAQKATVAQRRTVRMEMVGFGSWCVGDLTWNLGHVI